MSRNIGARAVSDTGSMTGVATVILALLSAGTVASISLVGAHQLARPATDRLRAGAPTVVRAPHTVVVTPHAAPTSGSQPVSHHSAKPHSSAPSDVTVVPAVLTSPTSQRPHVPKPHVHVPSVDVAIPAIPAIPAVAIPAVPTPPVSTPPVSTPLVPTLSQGPPVTAVPGPGYPDVTSTRPHRSRAVDAYTPLRGTAAAVVENSDRSRRGGRGCGEQRDGYGGDRGRANGPTPSSHGQHSEDGQHGQHGQHGH